MAKLSVFYKSIAICLFVLSFKTFCIAQTVLSPSNSAGQITMRITPMNGSRPLEGVSIKLYQDTVLLEERRTVKPDGWNESAQTINLLLRANNKYTLVLFREGYIRLFITLDTKVPGALVANKAFITSVDVKMLEAAKYPNLQGSDFPLVLLQYDPEQKKFLSNRKYAENMKTMLEK